MKKTALVIMAAGLGSRFGGGIKQLAKLGPGGEVIMEYSVYDAIKAGFDKVIFIIRREIEADFREIIGNRVEKHIRCEYAYQELADLPAGFSVPEGRRKPWGTAHALIQVRRQIDSPFAVINADDFYGREGFRLLHDYLTEKLDESKPYFDICIAGFLVGNTLSKNGAVNRGVCETGVDGTLSAIHETYEIREERDGIFGRRADGTRVEVRRDAIVSMNMFGLSEGFLDSLERNFPAWLSVHGGELKSEYLLPAEIDVLMQAGKARVSVLPDHDRWFGVTYQEDKAAVQRALRALHAQGVYPERLFD